MPRFATLSLASALPFMLLLAIAGCSGDPPTGAVTGTVILDGDPLPNAIVTFTPLAGGRSTIGTTDTTGTYTLGFRGSTGAPLGDHKVSIISGSDGSDATNLGEVSSDSEAYERQAMGSGSASYDSAATQELIPAEYNTNTTLTRTVEPGQNVFDFDLKSN